MRHGANHEAEGGAEQGTEAAQDDRAERTDSAEESPANDAEHAVVVERASLATRTSPEDTTTIAEDAIRAPVEEVKEAACGPTGGDANDVAHAARLEAALLAVSSLTREAHIEYAGAVETGPPPAATTEAEV
jgi:hypothetical protein